MRKERAALELKMPTVEQLRLNHARATKLLAKAVARAYPVGAPVWVKWGRGKMFARVAFAPCEWANPTCIGVISTKGEVHHRDYRDCRLVGV